DWLKDWQASVANTPTSTTSEPSENQPILPDETRVPITPEEPAPTEEAPKKRTSRTSRKKEESPETDDASAKSPKEKPKKPAPARKKKTED
ncbi:MAG TPA: hypothetical protein PK765_07625, partial [bacterium]|nr:hypothetical protein [bacterium]